MYTLGHVERKDDADWLEQGMKTFEGTRCYCVSGDMESFGMSREDAQDRDDWRQRIKGQTG